MTNEFKQLDKILDVYPEVLREEEYYLNLYGYVLEKNNLSTDALEIIKIGNENLNTSNSDRLLFSIESWWDRIVETGKKWLDIILNFLSKFIPFLKKKNEAKIDNNERKEEEIKQDTQPSKDISVPEKPSPAKPAKKKTFDDVYPEACKKFEDEFNQIKIIDFKNDTLIGIVEKEIRTLYSNAKLLLSKGIDDYDVNLKIGGDLRESDMTGMYQGNTTVYRLFGSSRYVRDDKVILEFINKRIQPCVQYLTDALTEIKKAQNAAVEWLKNNKEVIKTRKDEGSHAFRNYKRFMMNVNRIKSQVNEAIKALRLYDKSADIINNCRSKLLDEIKRLINES